MSANISASIEYTYNNKTVIKYKYGTYETIINHIYHDMISDSSILKAVIIEIDGKSIN